MARQTEDLDNLVIYEQEGNIVTLTLNPSVDRTVEVETLTRGEVVRALRVQVDPPEDAAELRRLPAHVAVMDVDGGEGGGDFNAVVALGAAVGGRRHPLPLPPGQPARRHDDRRDGREHPRAARPELRRAPASDCKPG